MTKNQMIGMYAGACILIISIIIGIVVGLSFKDAADSNKTNAKNNNNKLSILDKSSIMTYKRLGENGRLGNQLFQIAATLGFAKEYGVVAKFPKWKYHSLFEFPEHFYTEISEKELKLKTINLNETECFEFTSNDKDITNVPLINIEGYRQNSRYFNFIAHDLRRFFTFRFDLKSYVSSILSKITLGPLIGLHVRRGDYSANPVHEVCNLEYYIAGINFFRQKQKDAPVIIITDDKKWCEINLLPKLSNVLISPFESEEHDFICLSLCQFKVISNSTFAWWASWLDPRCTSEVLAPRPWINQICKSFETIYPSNWHIYDIKKENLTTSPSIPMNIGAYYQCYKQPHAFINACQSFRRVYPTSSLVIVNDDGDDFSKAAKYFNAISYKRNDKRGGNGSTTHITAFDQIIIFILNFIQGAKQITEPYFILLEDDVSIVRTIQVPASFQEYDILGNNSVIAKFPKVLQNYLKCDPYYGACGGSLFRTEFWANLDERKVEFQLSKFKSICNDFHTDVVLSFICYFNGGSICCGQTLLPNELVEKIDVKQETMPAVYHTYKELYNIPTTNFEEKIIHGKI